MRSTSIRTAFLIRAFFLVVMMPSAAAVAQTPSLTLLGVPADRMDSYGTSISADGLVSAGYSQGFVNGTAAFSWTAGGGRVDYGNAPGWAPVTRATGLSNNGSVMVGYGSATANGVAHAFRFSNGTYQNLSRPGFDQSAAFGTSGDGNFVVGSWDQNGSIGSRAMVWTPSGGMQDAGRARPGDLGGWFTGVSRDGTTAIGRSGSSGQGEFDAYTWTQGGGWQLLPVPAGTPGRYDATPTATNHDGSLIVGYLQPITGPGSAMLWQDQQPITLGAFGSRWGMSTGGVSDDGSVIVGGGRNVDTLQSAAAIWLNGSGAINLQEYLASLGAPTPGGWRLVGASSISSDGTFITGYAQQIGANRFQAFTATIPSPGIVALGVVALALSAPRRRRVLA